MTKVTLIEKKIDEEPKKAVANFVAASPASVDIPGTVEKVDSRRRLSFSVPIPTFHLPKIPTFGLGRHWNKLMWGAVAVAALRLTGTSAYDYLASRDTNSARELIDFLGDSPVVEVEEMVGVNNCTNETKLRLKNSQGDAKLVWVSNHRPDQQIYGEHEKWYCAMDEKGYPTLVRKLNPT